ncbi:MAG TPA: cyclopropane-fatty-acyl-phospholipid synthase family protein, partial [Solirubrobacteraceae bacterium]|nr:cyclopropane-fatty-acyl-phospholipid synthase family protein [Solirubrobacteraceae bacterium]
MRLRPTTGPLRRELAAALPQRPFTVRFWDGSELAATGGEDARVVLAVRSPRALAHVLRAPGQLGLSRAYVSGELAVSDLDAFVALLGGWRAPAINAATKRRLIVAAVRATGLVRPPRPPAGELRPRGRRHMVARDARAVRRHFDVPSDFFALFLDASMTYSCAIFEDPAQEHESLEAAQARKLELICTKLALKPGERVLDVGCGWGSFAIYAATRHDVDVVAINPSQRQAALARERANAAGVGGRVEIRVTDYRQLSGERYDAIASIGMLHYVDSAQVDGYAAVLASLLEPGGRLVNHGIARLRHGEPEAGSFTERYAFPAAAPLHLSRLLLALERAGLVCEHVDSFAEHYVRTLAIWARRLDRNAAAAERLTGPQRMRVWRLFLRATRSV